MQIYLSGTTPIFWKQVESLPIGVYNKENDQTSSALIPQTLVAFVNKPTGTILSVLINGSKVGEAKVVDSTGFAYAKLVLPYTKGQDSIDIQLRDTAGTIIASEAFSTSNIDFIFEIQSSSYKGIDGFTHGTEQTFEDAQQISEDNSIQGVDSAILENKFGVFTGLRRRGDQTVNTYRTQTACLWKAYQFAGTQKGLSDAIACVLGIAASSTDIVVTPTKSVRANLIFDAPQFDFTDHFTPTSPPLPLVDPDHPHYYVAIKSADFRLAYTTLDPAPIDIIDPSVDPSDQFSTDNVRSFTIHTAQAIGNENLVELVPTTAIGLPEDIAAIDIIGESILCRTSNTDTQPFRNANPDKLANEFIASQVKITEAVIGGTTVISLASLPAQTTDFTVDILAGEITWLGTAKQPDRNTLYKADYSFRLDKALQTVIKKVKPAARKVVVVFSNVTSGLPQSVIA